jgi:hypothetical protein
MNGNNEDAGDLEMMGAADYSGHLGEEHADGEHEAAPRANCWDCAQEAEGEETGDIKSRVDPYSADSNPDSPRLNWRQ